MEAGDGAAVVVVVQTVGDSAVTAQCSAVQCSSSGSRWRRKVHRQWQQLTAVGSGLSQPLSLSLLLSPAIVHEVEIKLREKKEGMRSETLNSICESQDRYQKKSRNLNAGLASGDWHP